MSRSLGLVCVVVLLALASGCGANAPPMVSALHDRDAFSRLTRALVGGWAASSGTRVSYRLVSNGTALVETWTAASGAETLTVYHPDHDDVLLTHYCAQGNQARLWLVSSSGARFRFDAR